MTNFDPRTTLETSFARGFLELIFKIKRAGKQKMGYSRAQKAASRQRILDIAGKQLKERGLESISIAEVMKCAGLTKGAFYAHFASRAELLLEATKHAKKSGQQVLEDFAMRKPNYSLAHVIDIYLSEAHIRNPGSGCVVCALASEGKSAPRAIRTELSDNYKRQVEFVAKASTGKSPQARAIGILSALMGAVSLARTLNDPKLVKTLLKQTKKLILDSQK